MKKRGYRRVRKPREILEEVLEFTPDQALAIAKGETDIAKIVTAWKGRKRIEIVSVRLIISNQYGLHQQKNVVSRNSLEDYFGPTNPLWQREGVENWVWGVVIRYVRVRKCHEKRPGAFRRL
jgi:hypothetical protein